MAMAKARSGNAQPGAPPAALTRVRFFAGRLLDADDLQQEQEYHREKQRRLVRALHGWGVVHGLQVGLGSGGSAMLTVAAGLAIDPRGELLEVGCAQRIALPAQGTRLYVVLAYAEEPCDPIPAPSDTDGSGTAYARIRETFRLSLEAQPGPDTLVLARLVRGRARWQVDRRFRRRRLSRRPQRAAV